MSIVTAVAPVTPVTPVPCVSRCFKCLLIVTDVTPVTPCAVAPRKGCNSTERLGAIDRCLSTFFNRRKIVKHLVLLYDNKYVSQANNYKQHAKSKRDCGSINFALTRGRYNFCFAGGE